MTQVKTLKTQLLESAVFYAQEAKKLIDKGEVEMAREFSEFSLLYVREANELEEQAA